MKKEYYEKHYGFLGQTLDEMLSHDEADRRTLFDAIFTRVELKTDYASFNDTERKFREVYLLLGEVGNGGLCQYFDNGPDDGPAFALAGLREMGAKDAANLFMRALSVFPDGLPPEDRDELQKLVEQVDDEVLALWQECSQEFCQQHQESIDNLAVEYVKQHRAEFRLPDFAA
jgi:hypothetical protein